MDHWHLRQWEAACLLVSSGGIASCSTIRREEHNLQVEKIISEGFSCGLDHLDQPHTAALVADGCYACVCLLSPGDIRATVLLGLSAHSQSTFFNGLVWLYLVSSPFMCALERIYFWLHCTFKNMCALSIIAVLYFTVACPLCRVK